MRDRSLPAVYVCENFSIFKKVDRSQLSEPDFSLLTLESEKNLILQLASFPDLVQKSASEYKPNGIARFALSLAKQFSSYYHEAKYEMKAILL